MEQNSWANYRLWYVAINHAVALHAHYSYVCTNATVSYVVSVLSQLTIATYIQLANVRMNIAACSYSTASDTDSHGNGRHRGVWLGKYKPRRSGLNISLAIELCIAWQVSLEYNGAWDIATAIIHIANQLYSYIYVYRYTNDRLCIIHGIRYVCYFLTCSYYNRFWLLIIYS